MPSGWAYTYLDYLNSVGGPTGSVQFRTDCNAISGSQYFVYSTASNNIGIALLPMMALETWKSAEAFLTQITKSILLGMCL